MKKFLFLVVTVLCSIFIACENETESFDQARVSFENVTIKENYSYNNETNGFTIYDLFFYNKYTVTINETKNEADSVIARDTTTNWLGFAVSKLAYTENSPLNEFSVYASGAANGPGQKYAVIKSLPDTISHFRFTSTTNNYNIKSLQINNAAITAEIIKNGNDTISAFTDGDWLKVTLTGLNSDGVVTGNIVFTLADYTEGKTFVCDQWQEVDMSVLGRVNRVNFTFTSNVEDIPRFVCIDDIYYSQLLEDAK